MATINARSGNSTSSLNVRRPSWANVYSGYPKTGAVGNEGDLLASVIFSSIFGPNYDTSIYGNACGTRVSLALLSAGMAQVGVRKIMITEKTHMYYGKYIEPGADKLKVFLESKWGKPDIKIPAPGSLAEVRQQLNGKKGIYIMIPKSPRVFGASGHATLWTGNRTIGDNDYISSNTDVVYFWGLK